MLAECLASLAAQTRPLHEVVVVDDGGSGSAREVVERFGSQFHYFWQPNAGQQSARNHGVRESSGEWIAFLDDDDLWLPERHSIAFELAATGQVTVIAGDFTKFGEGWIAPSGVFDEIAQQQAGFWDDIPREPDAAYSVVGSFPTTRLFPTSPFWGGTLIMRRDFFEQIGGWNEGLRGIKSEDNEFTFRAIKNGQLGVIWDSTMRYRTHPGNDSCSSLLNALGRTHIWETILLNHDLTDDERSALINAINKSQHEIVWSGFSKKEFHTVIKTSKKIGWAGLSIPEKLKVLISQIAIVTKIANFSRIQAVNKLY